MDVGLSENRIPAQNRIHWIHWIFVLFGTLATMGGQEMVRERLEDVVTRESDLAQNLFSDAAISSEQTHPQLVFVWDSHG